METKWLEDFLSLAETGSFSRSSQLRHVTQPAFSRRIQSLEAWAGTDLVDRSSYPTRLTPAGQTLRSQALELLQALQATRAMLRQQTEASKDTIEFAVPHTLAFAFFPAWLADLRPQLGTVKTKLTALNVHDAVMRLAEGSCDLLMTYYHPSHPIELDPQRYDMLELGQDELVPYVRPTAGGLPDWRWPGSPQRPMPMLQYAPGAYLGRVVQWLMKKSSVPLHAQVMYETDMAEGLKAMALEGHGVAFLPASAVRQELRLGRLLPAAPPGTDWRVPLSIRMYKPKSVPGKAKAVVNQFWHDLSSSATN